MTIARLFAAALLAVLVAPSLSAQDARLSNEPRTLFALSDSIKGDDGVRQRIVTTLVYEPAAGRYVHTTAAADGTVLSRRELATSVAAPTPDEAAAATSLIGSHAEIGEIIGRARGPVSIEGGFPLVREAGHACGPGGRCALYDVWETTPAGPQRLRYVIVDLRSGRVLDADADPSRDGNLMHPDARRQSRH